MSQNLIVLGDKTSHGGTVISAAPTTGTNGKAWARIGDKVSCPRCKGSFPIMQGDSGLKEDGLPVAYHGCKVGCGATLLAGQQVVTSTEPSSGAGNDAGGGKSSTALLTSPWPDRGPGCVPPAASTSRARRTPKASRSGSSATPPKRWPLT